MFYVASISLDGKKLMQGFSESARARKCFARALVAAMRDGGSIALTEGPDRLLAYCWSGSGGKALADLIEEKLRTIPAPIKPTSAFWARLDDHLSEIGQPPALYGEVKKALIETTCPRWAAQIIAHKRDADAKANYLPADDNKPAYRELTPLDEELLKIAGSLRWLTF